MLTLGLSRSVSVLLREVTMSTDEPVQIRVQGSPAAVAAAYARIAEALSTSPLSTRPLRGGGGVFGDFGAVVPVDAGEVITMTAEVVRTRANGRRSIDRGTR
jgi:hypothetical protein